MADDFPHESAFRVHREGVVVHLQTHNMTNHELRNILLGVWLSLDVDDRLDHIRELEHYLLPGSRPPDMAAALAAAWREALHKGGTT